MKTEVNKKPKTWIFSIANLQQGAKSYFLLTAVTLSLLSCSDSILDVTTEVQNQFENIEVIEVDAGFLDVSYTGINEETRVNLDGLIRANSDAYKIVYEVEGEVLKIKVVRNGGGRIGNFRSEGRITLTGPKQIELKLEAGSGNVMAKNVSSEVIELKVGSGRVELFDASADFIELDASSGKISAGNLQGRVQAIVSSGSITMQDVKGDIDLECTSGRLTLSYIDGLVNAHASSGKIELNRVNYLGKLTLSSGQISVAQSGLCSFTYLKASSGNITVQTSTNLSEYNYDLVSGSGKVRVGDRQASGVLRIENGAPYTIKGEVNSGKIEITN
ncbi:MAG TPA: DUF4097 family beta strand repeat-containing protein [Lunatimonas sp.]|nr:DUF4097 family beta strand repeat-containing protein [Lunatimonas sp.]